MINKYSFFVGLDISKGKLDYAVLSNNELVLQSTCENKTREITAMVSKIKKISGNDLKKCVFCMEHTGIYTTLLNKVLDNAEVDYVLENPLRLKASFGIARGKSDAIDAFRIAQYAFRHQYDLNIYQKRRSLIEELAVLVMLRNRLTVLITSLNNPIKEFDGIMSAQQLKQTTGFVSASLAGLKADLVKVESEIDVKLNSDERLAHLMTLITSVPRIGRITAVHMILATNEFKNINCPKKFASYAGVAPFPVESGTIKRKARVSGHANKKMKALLHICAMGASAHVPELKEYYLRKTEKQGKSKMSVLNAIRYKLILRVFACVNQDRVYIDSFNSKADESFEESIDCNSLNIPGHCKA